MKSQQGFTLIELLIVVAIIALIATLAMPNIRNAMQKGKRTATMADMQTISKAIQAYDLEWDTYPVASMTPINALRPLLEPEFVTELKIVDGWNNEYIYEGGADGFTIISYGRDGVPSGPSEGKIEDFNHDIRLVNGKFVTKP
jgi:general secretion pathway protein G